MFDFVPRTRVVFGAGAFERLGTLASELGFRRPLLVSDRGLLATPHVSAARDLLADAGADVETFHDFDANPDSDMADRGARAGRAFGPDSIVALGGGSALDCAKAVNFLLTSGGHMRDYRGYGKARAPLLPMIGIPTTAGTGSEAQSYAVIVDAASRAKMACGDPGAAFRAAILDPRLTLTAPAAATATAGIDALAHAVETWVTSRRTELSEMYAREAFRLVSGNFGRVLGHPDHLEARAGMLLGAHLAGAAIEASMLGAAHACANPLSRRYGTVHGVAVGLMLPHVVRWNTRVTADRYAELATVAGLPRRPEALVGLIEELVTAAGLPDRLAHAGVLESDLPALADDAATQWTGTFNPRPFDAAAALELYAAAF